MRWTRRATVGLALVAAIATTACPDNETDSDTSPAPRQSGSTGAVTGPTTVTGELTGPVGTGVSGSSGR